MYVAHLQDDGSPRGVIMYLFLPYNKTRGIRQKIPVGTRKTVQ